LTESVAHTAQNAFHRRITSLANHNGYSGAQELLSSALLRRFSREISQDYWHWRLEADAQSSDSTSVAIHVQPYRGGNRNVQGLASYLQHSGIEGLCTGIYVHGSLATDEEVAYSDLDALVILSDEAFRDTKALVHCLTVLKSATRFMYAQDPQQHHGWFVLTDGDLGAYCDAYLPVAVLQQCKDLLHKSNSLIIRPRPSDSEALTAFHSLAASIMASIGQGKARNLYELKSLVSRCLLIPAAYVHVRDGAGVWKKDSFRLAASDFEPGNEWSAISRLTEVRAAWPHMRGDLDRFESSSNFLARRYRKASAPVVPGYLSELFDDAAIQSIGRLVEAMVKRVQSRLMHSSAAGPK
jgi:hypothetical protein